MHRDVRKDEIIIGLKEQLKQTQQKLKRSEEANQILKERIKTLEEQQLFIDVILIYYHKLLNIL